MRICRVAGFEPPLANVWFDDLSAKNVDFSGGQYLGLPTKASVFEGRNFDRIRVEYGPLGQLPQPTGSVCAEGLSRTATRPQRYLLELLGETAPRD
jgi:hypothetical protein